LVDDLALRAADVGDDGAWLELARGATERLDVLDDREDRRAEDDEIAARRGRDEIRVGEAFVDRPRTTGLVEGSRRAHAEDLPAEARAFERETERSADEPHADDADRRERRCCGHDQRPPRRAARRARTLYRASARGIEGGVAALAGMQGAE